MEERLISLFNDLFLFLLSNRPLYLLLVLSIGLEIVSSILMQVVYDRWPAIVFLLANIFLIFMLAKISHNWLITIISFEIIFYLSAYLSVRRGKTV